MLVSCAGIIVLNFANKESFDIILVIQSLMVGVNFKIFSIVKFCEELLKTQLHIVSDKRFNAGTNKVKSFLDSIDKTFSFKNRLSTYRFKASIFVLSIEPNSSIAFIVKSFFKEKLLRRL